MPVGVITEYASVMGGLTLSRTRKVRPPERPNGGLLSAAEASAFMRISLAHFKDVVHPEIQTVAIGRQRLYDRKDLDRWVSMHK
jgi:hypothetical protein